MARMAELVDWGRQASYCRLQAKIGACINVDCQLKGQNHHGLMSCTRSYGRSIIELPIHTTSFKKIGKYPRLTKIQLKLIPVFHSTIPFYSSIH